MALIYFILIPDIFTYTACLHQALPPLHSLKLRGSFLLIHQPFYVLIDYLALLFLLWRQYCTILMNRSILNSPNTNNRNMKIRISDYVDLVLLCSVQICDWAASSLIWVKLACEWQDSSEFSSLFALEIEPSTEKYFYIVLILFLFIFSYFFFTKWNKKRRITNSFYKKRWSRENLSKREM